MAQVNDMEYLVRCFTFAMLKRNKMQEMEKKIVPQNTTEEMFAYIWGLDEAHSYLAPKLCFPSKSKGNATQYCRQGDMAFRKHKLCEALKYYNLAILSAPHPDSESSPRKGARSLNQVESILAQAFKSRSVVLFEIKRYEKCSDDIDLALKFGYPQTSCKKLLDMKIKCQKLISADKERMNPSAKALGPDDLYFAFEIPNPPPLAESNPTIPSLSSAVKMTFSQTMGRHVIAAKDINPGEILGVDEGYCSAVFFEDMKTYCTVCLTRCLTPLPCPCCSMVIFCSEECQKQGLSGCHWQECPILPTFSALDMGKNPYLAYRILMKLSHVRLKEIMPLLQCEAKTQAPETLGFNKEGIYDATDYRSVYHLVTNKDKRSKSDLIRRCMQAFIVTKLLQQSGRYFLDSDGKPLAPSHEDIILTGSTLIHHMMNLICNAEAEGIMEIDLTDPMMGSINESFGFGIYPGVCLLNHSCNPTCARITYGKSEMIRAKHFIPAGGPLTISYCEDFTEMELRSRRSTLLTQYHFTCKCDACENNWPTGLCIPPIVSLKCIKCDQVVNSDTKKCLQCQLNYDEPNVEAGRQNVNLYNYRHIITKIGVAQGEYFKAKQNISTKGIVSNEDLKSVRILIKLLCKYAKQPCISLVDAGNTLRYCLSLRGSHMYVRRDGIRNIPFKF